MGPVERIIFEAKQPSSKEWKCSRNQTTVWPRMQLNTLLNRFKMKSLCSVHQKEALQIRTKQHKTKTFFQPS